MGELACRVLDACAHSPEGSSVAAIAKKVGTSWGSVARVVPKLLADGFLRWERVETGVNAWVQCLQFAWGKQSRLHCSADRRRAIVNPAARVRGLQLYQRAMEAARREEAAAAAEPADRPIGDARQLELFLAAESDDSKTAAIPESDDSKTVDSDDSKTATIPESDDSKAADSDDSKTESSPHAYSDSLLSCTSTKKINIKKTLSRESVARAHEPTETKNDCIEQGSKKAKRPLPNGWRPYGPDWTFARELGLDDPERVLAHFRDYHLARGNFRLDWNAAWRVWCRRELELQRAAAPKSRMPDYIARRLGLDEAAA